MALALTLHRFLRETNNICTGRVESELLALRLFYKSGRHWAEAASQEVLALADHPTLTTSQSLYCLTLYWFADGKIDRADIHLSNVTLFVIPSCAPRYAVLYTRGNSS